MWYRLAVLILTLHFTQIALAQEEGRFEMSEQGTPYWLPDAIPYGTYNDFKEELLKLKPQETDATESEQCRSSYQKLFSKPDLYWSVYFGYGDGASKVYTTDMAERDLFEKELKSPCPAFRPEIQLCDFKEVSVKSGEYVKQITTKENQVVNVHLKLYNSSLTSEIAVNKEKRAEQKAKSKALEKSFLNALHSHDIVFYSGHARNGSGPGFRPLSKNPISWISKNLFRPMASKMYNALENDEDHDDVYQNETPLSPNAKSPSVIGFFSCEAEAHYGVNLAHRTDAGLILTRQSMETRDNMRVLYAASNNLLTQTCEKDFNQNMTQAMKTLYYRPKKGVPTNYEDKMPKFFNFFHKDKVKYRNDLLLYLRNRHEVGIAIEDIK